MTLKNGNRSLAIDPLSGLSVVVSESRSNVVIGDFLGGGSIASGDQVALGTLELSLVATPSKSKSLVWTLPSQEVTFGARGDYPFACYVDSNGTADLAVKHGSEFKFRTSTGRTRSVSLKNYGAIRSFECADVRGFGRDQLIVLTSRRPATSAADKRSAARPHIVVVDIERQRVISTEPVDRPVVSLLVGDPDGDGKLSICRVNKLREGSFIECPAGTGAGSVRVAVDTVSGLLSGTYFVEAGNRLGGFASIQRDGTLLVYGLDGTRKVLQVTVAGEPVKLSRRAKLIRCR